MNQEEANQKIVEIMNKEDDLSEKEIQLFKELMFQCDLKQQDKFGYTSLMYALRYNKYQKLNLNEEQWDYLIKNSDLNKKNEYEYTALMYALTNNKNQNLNLNEEQMDYLIKNSDLKIQDNNDCIPLMFAFACNKIENLNINKKQIDYLIKNSDLKIEDKAGYTSLMYALNNNKEHNLQLSLKQFQTMYYALDEEQQQKTFQNLIQKNCKNKYNYVDEMNILLYDCEFNPNKETINWLKENQHQDILEMIEKRNIFFQLNQDLKKIDNFKNISIIKL